MPKTALIKAIKANLIGINDDLIALAGKVTSGDYAQSDFANLSHRIAALKASIKALEDHTNNWDGSTSFKNLLKSKATLRAKRDAAVKYLNSVKAAANAYDADLRNLAKYMQQIVPGRG